MTIPLSEINLAFVRSSGPGGQKVNKTSTKVQLRWNVGASAIFTPEQKILIRRKLTTRINLADEIALASDRLRSQSQNRDFAIKQLERLITKALTPKKKRRATRPTRASKERRLEEKKRRARKKEGRRV